MARLLRVRPARCFQNAVVKCSAKDKEEKQIPLKEARCEIADVRFGKRARNVFERGTYTSGVNRDVQNVCALRVIHFENAVG